ncbi:MAG: SsrA-binding protein SmpB [Deltaproteobacteria bacterium]|nr:SsrA-binding protein SmpB [Deltaproteobacteria bacterium]
MSAGEKIIATNRKATFNYEIIEKYEAGLVLLGSEVKSLREGKANLLDAYGMVRNGEVFLYQCHINPYEKSGPYYNHDPIRPRKLLLHHQEIAKLIGKTHEKGFTLVPLKLYFKNGRAKVELGLGRGKKTFDKRETIKKREQDRELSKAMKKNRF